MRPCIGNSRKGLIRLAERVLETTPNEKGRTPAELVDVGIEAGIWHECSKHPGHYISQANFHRGPHERGEDGR